MMKEKKAMRRVVSLGLMLAMLIGLFPFMHIMNGRADDAKPITVRINGLEVCDATNLKDAIDQKKQTAINAIDVVSGVITEADFRDLKTANMHTGLKQITMNTMQVPSISDVTVFDGYASDRTIRVASGTVFSYKNAPDGNTDDNLWYGFNIVEDAALNSGSSTGTDLSEKAVKEVEFNLYAPVAGATPVDAVLKSSTSNYTVSQTIWSDAKGGFVSGKFVDGGSYKTMLMLKANTGYYFDANVKSIINNLATDSTSTPTVVTSKVSTTTTVNDTLALDITYKTSEDAAKFAIKGTIKVQLDAPEIGASLPNATVESGAGYTVAKTVWRNANGIIVTSIDGSSDTYTAEVTLTTTDANVFEKNGVKITTAGDDSEFTRGAATVVEDKSRAAVTNAVTFTTGFSRAGARFGAIDVKITPPEVGDVPVSPVPTDAVTYKIDSFVWKKGSTPMTVVEQFVANEAYTLEFVLVPSAVGGTLSPSTSITLIDTKTSTTYKKKSIHPLQSTDNKKFDYKIVYEATGVTPTPPIIADVSLTIPAPVIGQPPKKAQLVAGYTTVSEKWSETDNSGATVTLFEAGKRYSFETQIKAPTGSTFKPGDVKVNISDVAPASTDFTLDGAANIIYNSDANLLNIQAKYIAKSTPPTPTCPHSNFAISGPRVPDSTIPSGWSDKILAKVGGTAELKATVKCNDCGSDITSTMFYHWARVDRTTVGAPAEYLNATFVQGQSTINTATIVADDVKYDYYVDVSLTGTDNGVSSLPVKLDLADYSKPEPYFAQKNINKLTGEDVTFEVLSRLPSNPSTTNITYEWRKGAAPTDGTPSSDPVIGTDKVLTLHDLKITDAGIYHVTVTNKNGTDLIAFAEVNLKVTVPVSELIPIEAPDITALDLVPPVTGQTPVILTAPATADYTIKHSWRSSNSALAANAKFEAGKTYIADIKFIPKAGYRMGRAGASHIEVDVNTPYLSKRFVEMGENGSFCRVEVRYSVTMNPNKTDQSQLKFVGVLPEKKTYGDPDFALSVQGGSGDGEITFTSSDEKVLEVRSVNGSNAIISIVGSGNATITATKAGGKDDINTYNVATATTAKITVAPKILVVKASDKTIMAGTKTEIFPVEISGFVKGDNEYTVAGFVTPKAKAVIPEPEAAAADTTKKNNKKEQVKTPEELAAEEELRLNKLCGKFEIIPEGGEPTSAYVFRYVTGTLTVNRTGIADAPSPYENFIKSNSQTIEDRKNGIVLTDFSNAGFFDAGTQLVVENLTHYLTDEERALYNANINASFHGKELAQLYDITLKRDGFAVQPTGDVLVDIDLTSSLKGRYTDLQVAYISDYGDVTIMPFALSNEKATFITDHFGSKYAIIGSARYGTPQGNSAQDKTGNGSSVPQTSDANPSLPFLIGIALVSGGVIIVLKRKKYFFN